MPADFQDTVKNLLKMKPKPHAEAKGKGKKEGERNEPPRRPKQHEK